MKIDKRLNLVIPHERDDGSIVHIHSTPITTETFDQHFEILAQLWTQITTNYGTASAPRIAAKLLRKLATENDVLDGPLGVEQSLMGEIRRLTMFIMPRGSAQPTLMMDEAVKAGVLTDEDKDVVENALVFFTCVSAMLNGKRRKAWIETMCSVWDAQTSLLNSTAFAASLEKSSETDNSGAKTKAA